MEKEPKPELPYEENDESFGKWFREKAKDKWEKYLNENEAGISIEERDAMRDFLIKHGTEEEIKTKLDSLIEYNFLAYEALLEELKIKRPDFKLPKFEDEDLF